MSSREIFSLLLLCFCFCHPQKPTTLDVLDAYRTALNLFFVVFFFIFPSTLFEKNLFICCGYKCRRGYAVERVWKSEESLVFTLFQKDSALFLLPTPGQLSLLPVTPGERWYFRCSRYVPGFYWWDCRFTQVLMQALLPLSYFQPLPLFVRLGLRIPHWPWTHYVVLLTHLSPASASSLLSSTSYCVLLSTRLNHPLRNLVPWDGKGHLVKG